MIFRTPVRYNRTCTSDKPTLLKVKTRPDGPVTVNRAARPAGHAIPRPFPPSVCLLRIRRDHVMRALVRLFALTSAALFINIKVSIRLYVAHVYARTVIGPCVDCTLFGKAVLTYTALNSGIEITVRW